MKTKRTAPTIRAAILTALTTMLAASDSGAGESLPAGSTSILSVEDHARVYAAQKRLDDLASQRAAAEKEIAPLRESLSRTKGEFETTEEYKAQRDAATHKIEQIWNDLIAAEAKVKALKEEPLPTHMIVTFAYVAMGSYDADTAKIDRFSSLYSAEIKTPTDRIGDPYYFGHKVVDKPGMYGSSYHRAVSVSGKFAGIVCSPAAARKARDASNHHRLLAKVLVPEATTICKRENVTPHESDRPEDLEVGLDRFKAALKVFVSNSFEDAQVIEISAKAEGTILELFDANTSIWKAGDR